jgi:O-antigen ligase
LSALPAFFNNKKLEHKTLLSTGLLFVVLSLISYLWREASAEQWFRGFRFTLPPIILLLILSQVKFSLKYRSQIIKAIFISATLIVLTALLDFINLPLPLTTSLSSTGSLESAHYVGLLEIKRAQGVLAGPNALALFMLPIFALSLVFFKKSAIFKAFAVVSSLIIILTFSRSALIGLLVIVFAKIWQKSKKSIGTLKTFMFSALILLVLVVLGVLLNKTEWGEQIISHNSSSSMRYEQYQRIWQQKQDICLLGRGLGTAGPSSINRLDEGENHWTENVYLDIFEELGIVGIALFVLLIVTLIINIGRQNSSVNKAAYFSLYAYAISGLFINIYTGQVGLWYTIILSGMALGYKSQESDE